MSHRQCKITKQIPKRQKHNRIFLTYYVQTCPHCPQNRPHSGISRFRNKHCGSERFVHFPRFFIFVFFWGFLSFSLGILGFKG